MWKRISAFAGPRILKTGLAVFFSQAIFHWFGSSYAAFGAVAAIMAVQPSIRQARDTFRQQILGNAVAGAIATLVGLLLPVNPLTTALAATVVLALLVRLKLTEAAGLAVVVVLFVLDRPEHDYLLYTAARLGTIVGGMTIGYAVNRLIKPPDVLGRARDEIDAGFRLTSAVMNKLILSLGSPADYPKSAIRQDAALAEERLSAAHTILALGSADADPHRAGLLRKARAALLAAIAAVMDIHRLLLAVGGLQSYPERQAMVSLLRSLSRYQEAAMAHVLHGADLDPAAAQDFAAALEDFQYRAQQLIDQRERRAFGLALHQVLAEVHQMGSRLSTLLRLGSQHEGRRP